MFVLNLGVEPYERAWELQHRLVEARQKGQLDDILILLEHEPVITLGRTGDESHILASAEELREAGIAVHRVERGGDVTYHGPGQLVGYPILSLEAHHLGVSDFMHALEEVLIRTLHDFGLSAYRREGIIGVWVGESKIAALGARVERGVTYHGFALNVAPNLAHFALIIPCGLVNTSVTSMEHELGRPVPMPLVRHRVVENFGQVFGVPMDEITFAQLPFALKESEVTASLPGIKDSTKS
ncbi:MAG: lipoyl(octanoyl) transferase LipB [Chloroflexi bacterium]|nr:lipoyl(octanoyl) transferase LipB [Chloroflexota bacterium]